MCAPGEASPRKGSGTAHERNPSRAARSRIVEAALVAFALATFCFLPTWVGLAEGRGLYFARYNPRVAVALPVIGCELILAPIIYAAYAFLRRSVGLTVRRIAFLIACLPVAGIAGFAILRMSPVNLVPPVHGRFFLPVAISTVAVATITIWRKLPSAVRIARGVLLWSCPVLAFILLQAFRIGLAEPAPAFADRPSAAALPGRPAVRVVWVVFDELSYKIAFDDRVADLRRPNFDRLRAESFDASAAPPADSTLVCMPALILGKKITKAIALGARRLQLDTRSGAEIFGEDPGGNVFDDTRRLGYNTALAGWYHPYCRILSGSLTDCFWVAGWMAPGIEEPAGEPSLASDMWLHARLSFLSIPFIGHVPGVSPDRCMRIGMAERTGELMSHGSQIAANPAFGLTLLHIPVPHPPSIYNRRLHRIVPDDDGNSYIDSIAQADDELGLLRAAMEKSGVWNNTALVVSSDHGWRPQLWRGGRLWTAEDENLPRHDTLSVPFIVRLPGQTSAVTYSKPFNTVVTRSVIRGILRGDIRTFGDIGRLIDTEKTTGQR